jgi:hypothetical protein
MAAVAIGLIIYFRRLGWLGAKQEEPDVE